MRPRIIWCGLVFALLLLGSCLRSGFELGNGAGYVVFTGDEDKPFGDATTEGATVIGGAAQLVRELGLELRSTRLPVPSSLLAAAGIGNEIYVAGGAVTANVSACSDQVLLLDPVEETLTPVYSMSASRRGMALLTHPNGLTYGLMGWCPTEPNSTESQVYRFNHVVPIEQFGEMPDPVFEFAAGVLPAADGSRLLVTAGGFGSGPLTDSVQTMNVNSGATQILATALPSPRCQLAGAVSNDTLFLFGGNTQTNCSLPTTSSDPILVSDILAVTLEPEQVTHVASLPQRMALSAAATRADGTIALFGGVYYREDGSRAVSDEIFIFDPVTHELTTHPKRLPSARAAMAAATTADGNLFLIGGGEPGASISDEVFLFEPYAEVGTLTGPLVDSGRLGARWSELAIDAELPAGTGLQIELRVTDEQEGWSDTEAEWHAIADPGALPEELPRGRHLQWRIHITSDNHVVTPRLYGLSLKND